MPSSRLAFPAVAAACILAAFAGGYVASRQNFVPVPAAALEPAATPASAAPAAAVAEPAREEPTVSRSPRPQPPARRVEPREAVRAAAQPASSARTANTTIEEPAVNRIPPAAATPQSLPFATPPAAPVETSLPAAASSLGAVAEESPRAPDPPERTFVEVVVPASAVIGLVTESRLSSETARIEDRIEARVTRDVRVGNEIAIPAGARAVGSVTQVEQGGRLKERARLGIRFHTVVLADGAELPISTETVYREGEAPGNSSAAKIGGGAVTGAIIGAIIGGSKGAAIGAGAGAGGGAAAVAASERKPATFPAGTQMTVRIQSPVAVTIEK